MVPPYGCLFFLWGTKGSCSRFELQQSCICALWLCGGLWGSSFLTRERFFKKSQLVFRWNLDTTSLHILKIELKKSLFSTEIAISGNLHLWLGHFTCSKLIFYERISNFHINRIIFIILGEHYIKKLGFQFFLPHLVLCTLCEREYLISCSIVQNFTILLTPLPFCCLNYFWTF